ncbi:unnamed protein product [Calypogeia fissa]
MATMRNAFGLLVLVLVALGTSNINVAAMKWQSGWSALVTGSVFCDQCLTQEVFPFSYPLKDARVSVKCYDSSGVHVVASATATTDFFGGYIATFKGVSDLGGCKAFVLSSPDSSCKLVDGGGKTLSLKSKFLWDAFYIVDPLFYKPAQPKDFCPGHPHPEPHPIPLPPKPPGWDFPPLPPFPWKDFSTRKEPSTCASDDWLNPTFFCYWKNASPHETTVGQMFGKAVEKKYGNISVYKALQSGDDLLKQAVAAMMNSNTNKRFYMSADEIKKKFNGALGGARQLQWETAWSFKQFNSGYGQGRCMMTQLTPCKT